MPKILHFKKETKNVIISKVAYDYIINRKLYKQTFGDSLDQIISDYRQKEVSVLREQVSNLQKINEHYLNRIHEIEKKQQTVFKI